MLEQETGEGGRGRKGQWQGNSQAHPLLHHLLWSLASGLDGRSLAVISPTRRPKHGPTSLPQPYSNLSTSRSSIWLFP